MIRHLVPVVSFTLVAVASFSVWAFAGSWFSSAWGLYLTCAIVFLVLGGVALLPFSGGMGRQPLWQLVWIFPLSFLCYAVLWCVGWFMFRSHFGELLGSALGLVGMTAIIKARLGSSRSVLEAASVVFFAYTLGYYLGEEINADIGGLWGKLGWGIGYGGGLGAGLVYLIQLSAKSRN